MQLSVILAVLAAASDVTTTLRNDPPLPGEPTGAWQGLDPADAPQPASADARVLDESTAVRMALENNRELRATLREVGIAEGRLQQAGAVPNPHVEGEKPPEPETKLELGIEYDLTDLLLSPLRARPASADVAAARERAAAAAIETGFLARAAFRSVQSAEQRLAIARRALDAFAAARDTARALFDAGNVAEVETAAQDAAYERARVVVAGLELEVATARERLSRVLGITSDASSWRVRGPLPPPPRTAKPVGDLETRAIAASLELKELRNRIDATDARRRLSRAEGWIPDVSVGARAARLHHDNGHDAVEKEWGYGVGVTIGIPLFDRNQGTTRAHAAERDSLRERHQGLTIEIRAAARETAARLRSAHARARHYQDVVLPAQRRVTQQTLLQYNAMQVGIFQLLAARREELDAELAYVETLREHWTVVAAVDALIAGRRPGAVAPAAAPGMSTGSETGGGH